MGVNFLIVRKVYLIVSCLIIVVGLNAQVLNNNPGFENGTWKNEWQASSQNSSDALIEVVSNRVFSGNYAFHVRHSSKGSSNWNRAEVLSRSNFGAEQSGYFSWHKEYWIGFAVYLEDYTTSLITWTTILQMHGVPANYNWGNCNGPPSAFLIAGQNGKRDGSRVGEKHLFIMCDEISNPYTTPPQSWGTSIQMEIPHWWIPDEEAENKWITFVGNFVISPDSDGKMKWWVDDELVIDFAGPNTYAYDRCGKNAEVNLLQLGSYKDPSTTNEVNLYYDDIKIGDASASYADVAPRGGNPTNTQPNLNHISDQTLIEDDVKNINILAMDPDGDDLVLSISDNPGFISLIDNSDGSGIIRIVPKVGDAGTYSFKATVTDEKNAKDSEIVLLTVLPKEGNAPPILNPIGGQTVQEGNQVVVTISAFDPDGDNLSFSLSGNPGFVDLTDNQNGTASIEISPVVGDAGTHNLTIRVTDSNNDNDSENITILVNPADLGNEPPKISNILDQRVTEGSTIEVSLNANDPDGSVMIYSLSPQLDFVSLSDNNDGTGNITISPESGDFGTYDILVKVTDENNSNDFELFVLTVDKFENGNSVPVLVPIEDQLLEVGEKLELTLKASDSDGDPLSFNFSPKLNFITLNNNGDGTAKLIISPVAGDDGKYNISAIVSDNHDGSDTKSFSIIIQDNSDIQVSNIINSGGSSVVSGSMLLQEDKYYNGGNPYSYIYTDISGTNNDELYLSARIGNFNYEIPVQSKELYTVILHFAEVYYVNGEIGSRIFDVHIEDDQEKLINFDINGDAGPLKAITKIFTGIKVNDNHLSIEINSLVDVAIISGIEVISETEKVTALGDLESSPGFLIYPNPSNGLFALEMLSDDHINMEIPYVIYNLTGKIIHQSKFKGKRESIDVSGINKGIYLIKVGGNKLEKIIIN